VETPGAASGGHVKSTGEQGESQKYCETLKARPSPESGGKVTGDSSLGKKKNNIQMHEKKARLRLKRVQKIRGGKTQHTRWV